VNKEKKSILIIEDEVHIAEGLKLNLNLQGYDVVLAENGKIGIEKWEAMSFDLVVLDLMMPVMDGNSVLRAIRKKNESIPILVLSAKDAVAEKVKCLRDGVDDYMVKPFDLDEFLLRIQRLLQRSVATNMENTLFIENFSFGNNTIDFGLGVAQTREGKIQLTSQELKILKLFISNPGVPLPRERLLTEGWGYKGDTTTRTVDNFIVRFRKYFENDPKNPIYFKSVRSIGYIFDPNGQN
jgi:two-component system, OmpR family, alkaline phosphatase synthesis response regulator PhoP